MSYHENKSCINIQTRVFENAMFENSVDATYILHLEGNGRLPEINTQLSQYKPTKIVHIVFNKGYKNCTKILPAPEPAYDLFDTTLFIMKDAADKNYENILILEDDFIFTPKIYQSNHLQNINSFLNDKKEEKMVYYLGCLSWAQLPFNSHTNINILSTGTHAVIYSRNARIDLLQKNPKYLSDVDIYHNFFWGVRRYVYKEPICYQLFPETENSEKWASFFGFNPIKLYINAIKLDTELEPGYSYTYSFAKVLGFILIILLLYIAWLLIKWKFNFKFNSKKIKK